MFAKIFSDPYFLPMEQVDKGAIRFVLSGANIMCPGLTSPGAIMTPAAKGTIVVSFEIVLNYIKRKLHDQGYVLKIVLLSLIHI